MKKMSLLLLMILISGAHAFDNTKLGPLQNLNTLSGATVILANGTWKAFSQPNNASTGICCKISNTQCQNGTSPSIISGIESIGDSTGNNIQQIRINPTNPGIVYNSDGTVSLFVYEAWAGNSQNYVPVYIKYTLICSVSYGYPPFTVAPTGIDCSSQCQGGLG